MRAAVYTGRGGPEVIQIQERPQPEFGPELVLVRVMASGLNRADVMQREGNYPPPPGAPKDIPGLELAGQVEAVGSGVTSVKPGDRVFGLTAGGGHAEQIVSHERLLVSIPESLDWIQAAAVPEAFITAHDALFTQGQLQPGQSVLIHAVGSGVGTAAVQLAHAVGCTVFGTARTAAKLEQAGPLGLDVPIDVTQQEFAEVVKERTGGRGVDVVIDFIGGSTLAPNLACLALRGRLVEVAFMQEARGTLDIGLLMRKRAHIVGTVLRSRPLEDKGLATRLFAEQVVPQLARGTLRPIVDSVFPLEQLAEAHRCMEENRNFGKIVIAVSSGPMA
jgi:putative PIG3 family NAD(P)H quinone oxidoreductase